MSFRGSQQPEKHAVRRRMKKKEAMTMDQSKAIPDDNDMFSPVQPPYTEHWCSPVTLPAEMEGFSLQCLLGSGSTGRVYKAVQTKDYAVKVVPWRTGNDRELAVHEYELGQMFSFCDEILHSVGYYEQGQQSYIVMEYGIPCLSYFVGRKNSTREILNTILRVSLALEAIHAHGYTHFDVKPENIVMVKGKAKLADFSHCSMSSQNQTYMRPMGTGVYIAPEIKADGKHTGREDIYSLGITMYTLLMGGRPPFDFSEKETPRREKDDIINSLYIHPELLAIIRKAAAYDANDRYTGMHNFSSDIQAFMESYSAVLDDEMPLYNIYPPLQETIPPYIPSSVSPIIWDTHEDNPQSPNPFELS